MWRNFCDFLKDCDAALAVYCTVFSGLLFCPSEACTFFLYAAVNGLLAHSLGSKQGSDLNRCSG